MREINEEKIKQVLSGHTSEETAYLVEDYPYGYTLRCKIRYWLEFKEKNGFRLVSQTTNPKRGDVWNKPKASTYNLFGAMFLDEKGHVQWDGLSMYADTAEYKRWREVFGAALPEESRLSLDKWIAKKEAYEANRAKGQDMNTAAFNAVKDVEFPKCDDPGAHRPGCKCDGGEPLL